MVSLCALVVVPMASAGWEGQIDFAGSDDDGGGYHDVAPVGPSQGDFFVVDQTIEVNGLTYTQGPLQLGAQGTLSGVLSFASPTVVNANVTIKLAAGWIRISGWLDPAIFQGQGSGSSHLMTKGAGGIFTGSRGSFVIYPGNSNGNTRGAINPEADFSVIFR